ncbi:hypothetical protein ABTZ46_11645 [Nocardioides sp. NPDC126508]
MSKKSAPPTPRLIQAEDETWTLDIPGVATSKGHPAPEWAMAKGVEVVRRAAADIVRTWINGKPVSDAEKQVVLLVTRGDSQVYAWLDAAFADDNPR